MALLHLMQQNRLGRIFGVHFLPFNSSKVSIAFFPISVVNFIPYSKSLKLTSFKSLSGPQAFRNAEIPTQEQLNSPTTIGATCPSTGMKSAVHNKGSGSPPKPIAVIMFGISL